jgi:hypothetical protein
MYSESHITENAPHALRVPATTAERTNDAHIGSALPILVHCHLRWDFVWQRPQHVFSRLAARHPIAFVEEPVAREGEPHLLVTEPCANLFRIVPIVASGEDPRSDRAAHCTRSLLEQALREHRLMAGRFEAPVQWFFSPMTAPVMLGRFGERGVVYDCMDELANFRFAPPDIGERERFLISRADVVFTGGFRLFEAKSRLHRNVHFFGCGVDLEHFARARDPATPLPAEIARLPRPRLGYFGVIDERLDYDLLTKLADRMPGASIVMVGPVAKVDPATLPQRPNIHWLGQRDYSALPQIVKAFDVCLMPFAMNESTRYINPTKTLEYMAGGKPIVSTAVPDVLRNFTPIVKVASNADAFVRYAASAAERPDAKSIADGIERASSASWDAIVEQMRARMLAAQKDRATTTGPMPVLPAA